MLPICVPYTNLQPITAWLLKPYKAEFILLDEHYTYKDYFKDMWQTHINTGFINIEHDTIFWPGALEALWDCPEHWCAYGYNQQDKFWNELATKTVYLGCTKFSSELISQTPKLPQQLPDQWLGIDTPLTQLLKDANFRPHQHYPAVINANPVLYHA